MASIEIVKIWSNRNMKFSWLQLGWLSFMVQLGYSWNFYCLLMFYGFNRDIHFSWFGF